MNVLHLPSPRSRLQRLFARLLVTTCSLIAFGVAGAVVGRTLDSTPLAVVSGPHEMPAMVADEKPGPRATDELLQPLASMPAGEDGANRAAEVAPGAGEVAHAAGEVAHRIVEAPHTRVGRTVRMEVTAYCPCTRCCGPAAKGITASGKRVDHDGGRFVAADTRVLPFGTRLSIPGYHDGVAVEVIDRGGAIKGNRLDVYFPSHEQARQWGRRQVDVIVFE